MYAINFCNQLLTNFCLVRSCLTIVILRRVATGKDAYLCRYANRRTANVNVFRVDNGAYRNVVTYDATRCVQDINLR